MIGISPLSAGLRWLMHAGPDVPPAVRQILHRQLVKSPTAVVMGSVNALLTLAASAYLAFSTLFVIQICLEVALISVLVPLRLLALRARKQHDTATIEVSVGLSVLWCALQGTTSLAMMLTGNSTLQTLSATMIMGIIGPICARNYPAPRLTFLMICLCDFPFVAGGCIESRIFLITMIPMTPPFLAGAMQIVRTLNRMAVTALTAEQESSSRSLRDPLTGVLNRLALNDALPRALAGAQYGLALLCLDLDGFKAVNDTLGHQAGDAVLQAVAARLTRSVREQDSVYRIGGDEFVILVISLAPDQVSALADRLIQCVTDESYSLPGQRDVRIGVSVGFACAPEDGTDGDELYRKADSALYTSKAAGKGVQRRFALVASAA